MLTHLTKSPATSKEEAVPGVASLHVAFRKPAAIEMSEKTGLSLRSCYRLLRSGKTPGPICRRGKDGKLYHLQNLPKPDPVDRDLKLAGQALNRAKQHNANDLELLTRIWGLVGVMLQEAV